MEERMARNDDAEKAFDPEMTEPDEANAPDDTGPTAHGASLGDDVSDARDTGDQDEVGI